VEHGDSGEFSVYWQSGKEPQPAARVRGQATDPERAATEAAGRARRALRRYCVANGLDHLWTLTYAPEHLPDDEDGVWRDIERFRRRLRDALGEFPLAAVIEHGSESGRLHVHFLVAGRLPIEVVAGCWGKGFVQVEPPKRTRGLGKRARLRRTASYLTKYVGKEFDQSAFNRRRYSVSKGYQPAARRRYSGRDFAQALAAAAGNREVECYWASPVEGWPGFPVVCFRVE
jgi:hypothetical protein